MVGETQLLLRQLQLRAGGSTSNLAHSAIGCYLLAVVWKSDSAEDQVLCSPWWDIPCGVGFLDSKGEHPRQSQVGSCVKLFQPLEPPSETFPISLVEAVTILSAVSRGRKQTPPLAGKVARSGRACVVVDTIMDFQGTNNLPHILCYHWGDCYHEADLDVVSSAYPLNSLVYPLPQPQPPKMPFKCLLLT